MATTLLKLSWTCGCTLGGYKIEKKAALWMAIKLQQKSGRAAALWMALALCKKKRGCTLDGYTIV